MDPFCDAGMPLPAFGARFLWIAEHAVGMFVFTEWVIDGAAVCHGDFWSAGWFFVAE